MQNFLLFLNTYRTFWSTRTNYYVIYTGHIKWFLFPKEFSFSLMTRMETNRRTSLLTSVLSTLNKYRHIAQSSIHPRCEEIINNVMSVTNISEETCFYSHYFEVQTPHMIFTARWLHAVSIQKLKKVLDNTWGLYMWTKCEASGYSVLCQMVICETELRYKQSWRKVPYISAG